MPDAQNINGGEEAEKGVSTVVFTIVICTIVLLIVVGAMYVVVSDRLNGMDAYRTKAIRDQRDGFRNICEENYKTSVILSEWIRQQQLKPPPEFLVQKVCVQPDSVEDVKNK